ncbi:MAG: hypothetical protein WAV04_00885 [Candidatus Microsaccharimonas sp.]|jgi:hypothetical protein
MRPDWLPAPLTFGNSLDDDYTRLHKLFRDDIVGARLTIDGFPIIVNTAPDKLMPQYEQGFTHLVTRTDDTLGMRIIDYPRAEKLHWIPAIINNYTEPEVHSFWVATPKGETLYLWLHEHDHILVLRWTSKSKNRKILLTSYAVDHHNRRYYQRLLDTATRIL